MPTFSQATEDLIAKAATRAVMSDVEAGRDRFLAEPWKFDRLFRGLPPADWREASDQLSTSLAVAMSRDVRGHWASDANRTIALQQACAAASDDRFPTVWAKHIRDRHGRS